MHPSVRDYLSVSGTVWLWIAVLVSAGLFAYRLVFFVRVLHLAGKEDRFQQLATRLRIFFTDVFVQPRLRDGVIWPAHLLIFWGFLFFALAFGLTLLKGLFPFLAYPWPEDIRLLNSILEVGAVLVLAALGAAGYRRFVVRPPGVKQTPDAAFILLLIGFLMITFLSAGLFKRLEGESQASVWSPVSSLLAAWLGQWRIRADTASMLSALMWWGHVLLVLGFLAYLPYSKHFHLLAAPFSVFLTDLHPQGRLLPEERLDSKADELYLKDFTWRELLTPLSCAECGRCDRACPAYNSGTRLSPQMIVHHLKEHLLEAGPVLLSGHPGSNSIRSLIDGIVSPEEFQACTTCLACTENCPVRNEHLPLIMRMRRQLVSMGRIEEKLQGTLRNYSRYGNSFGKSERVRTQWTQGLTFKPKDARREPVEYLWFVGDYASYDPRVQEVTRTVAQVFQMAGLDFGLMYDAERNSGNDLRRIGEEGLFQLIAEKNIASLERCKFQRIVTTDPHTYNTLKNEYPDLGGRYEVYHYTELLLSLIRAGRLSPKKNGHSVVTYHDPCYLGRYNGIFEEPRRVLEALGLEIHEMPRNGKQGYCCGAGGGRIWAEDKGKIADRPADSRLREAATLQGIQTMVVSCPKDLVMFQDAAKNTGNEGRIAIKDIAQLVWESAA